VAADTDNGPTRVGGSNMEMVVDMKRLLLWLAAAAILVAAFLVYRARSGSDLNATPDAQRAIEKAKSR
jgi:hypothetical protein